MAVMKLNSGMRIGRLTLIEEAGLARSGNMRWRCRCSCGKEVVVFASSLRNGNTLSCGCYRKKRNPYKRDEPKQGCQKTDCIYYNHECSCCVYFDITGTSRTFLHFSEDVDINNPCREYEPRPKGYNPKKAFHVHLY